MDKSGFAAKQTLERAFILLCRLCFGASNSPHNQPLLQRRVFAMRYAISLVLLLLCLSFLSFAQEEPSATPAPSKTPNPTATTDAEATEAVSEITAAPTIAIPESRALPRSYTQEDLSVL